MGRFRGGRRGEALVKNGTRVAPVYPPAAQAAGFAGTVRVAATVRADGRLGAVEVIDDSAPGVGFDEAALAAVRQWKFDPARVDGAPVDSVKTFAFRFEPAPGFDSDSDLGVTVVGSGSGGAGSAERMVLHRGGSSDAAHPARIISSNRAAFATPNFPTAGPRQMYDRSTVLPQPSRGVSAKRH